MMTETQTQDVGQALQNAVLQAAVDASSSAPKVGGDKGRVVSPINGAEMPAGRAKGTPNRVTRTIREAVEKAARDCHSDGLAGWLIERAKGGIQDRQIFAQMVNKAMPLQVQANVDGGIKLELSWLSSRSIGTSTAQIPEQRTQVIDLQPETDGTYRIRDQETPPPGGAGDAAGGQGAGQAGGTGQGDTGPASA